MFPFMKMTAVVAGALLTGLAPSRAAEPLKVFSAPGVLEAGLLLFAIEKSPTGAAVSGDGGVANLWSDGKPGAVVANLAGNSETQLLRVSAKHPDARILLTVVEGLYRIVARRSAGISKLSDLRGKRIGAQLDTSSEYFVQTMLAQAGLTEADVTIVPLMSKQMSAALIARDIDAMAIWEPEPAKAEAARGADAIELKPQAGGYRELYNLYATAESLADPVKRVEIVAFVRNVMAACRAASSEPARIHALVSPRTGYDTSLIAASWRNHRFPCAIPDDLVDALVAEDQWLAKKEGRTPRNKEAFAAMVDGSILKEAAKAP